MDRNTIDRVLAVALVIAGSVVVMQGGRRTAHRSATTPPRASIVAPVTLPEGTPLTVRTTGEPREGRTFVAHLEEPLVKAGREIAPKGAAVEGQVVETDPGVPLLRLTRLLISTGRAVYITSSTVTPEDLPGNGGNQERLVAATRRTAAVIPIATVLHFELRTPVTISVPN